MPPIHTGSVAIPKPYVARAIQEVSGIDEMFVADKILPIFPTRVQDGTLPVVQREDMLRIENTVLGPGAAYGRVAFREKGLLFHCVKNGEEAQIPDETRAFYRDAFDAEVVAARQVYANLRRSRENRVAAAVLNATTWTGAALYTDVSGAPWSTVGSDVVSQIAAAVEKVHLGSGLLPNALIMNTTNVNYLIANTVIRARFPGATLITRQMLADSLASIFGITQLIECGSVKNSAIEGQDHVGAYVWSSTYAMVARVRTGATPEEPGLGVTMKWDAVPSMSIEGEGAVGAPAGEDSSIEVTTYREEQTDSDVVKVKHFIDELILGAAYGHLLKVV